ncbi:hypothetical protein Tco_1404721, partial [Tanacetum coccineum]
KIHGSRELCRGVFYAKTTFSRTKCILILKSRFETYVKSKDIDLWQVIQNGDFYFEVEDEETKLMKETPYELLKDTEKKQLGKNEEAKMTIYNALPRKEYERVFMCKTAKEVWHTLIITHQGNSQVKNCKIDLLTQEYEKFSISNEETIDSGFTRFNAIVTSLKSLDPDYSSKNHVYEMVLDNDGLASKTTTKEKLKSLALKAKVTREQTSDDSDSQDESDEEVDEEEAEAYNLLARDFHNKGPHATRGMKAAGEPRAFYGRSNDDSEDGDKQPNDATCLMAIELTRVKKLVKKMCLTLSKVVFEITQEIMDSGCTKDMIGNIRLFTSYKAYDGGHVVFGRNLKGKVNGEVSFTKVDCDISKNGKLLAKGHRRNGLYTCKLGDNSKQQICLASVVDNSTLWHRRLGHAIKSTWMAFGGNTRDLAHLEKKRTTLRLYTKSFEETVHTERGDGVADIK